MESGINIMLNSVRTICPGLTNTELSGFASILRIKNFKKKEIFLQSGKTFLLAEKMAKAPKVLFEKVEFMKLDKIFRMKYSKIIYL